MQCGWSIIINQSQRSSSAAAHPSSGRVSPGIEWWGDGVRETAPRETAIVEGGFAWPRPELHPGTTVTQSTR